MNSRSLGKERRAMVQFDSYSARNKWRAIRRIVLGLSLGACITSPVLGQSGFPGGAAPNAPVPTSFEEPTRLSSPPVSSFDAKPIRTSDLPDTGAELVDVRVEGNVTIPASAIAKYITTRAGRAVDEAQIRKDVRAVYGTSWFLSVEPSLRQTEEGLVLVFRVVERPIVRRVEYKGNDQIKTKHLAVRTGIEPGSPFDVAANREAAQVLEEYYRKEKGFAFATVELEKGGSRQDREVVFKITEGPKVVVTKIGFTGNETFPDTLLKTKTVSKTAFLGLVGGQYEKATIPQDIAALKQYYHGLGYFDVKITEDVQFADGNWVPLPGERAHAHVNYIIEEGIRYRVNRIDVYGSEVIPEQNHRVDMKLQEGDYFNARFLAQDINTMQDKYGELGRVYAKVNATPRFLEEPGVVDLVYEIDEDMVYRIRRVDVVFRGEHPHTKKSVVLNRVLTRPGELANARDIELSRKRLGGAGLFERSGPTAPKVNMQRVEPELERGANIRGQSPDGAPGAFRPLQNVPTPHAGEAPIVKPISQPQSQYQPQLDPAQAIEYPDVYTVLRANEPMPVAQMDDDLLIFRGQSFEPFIPPLNPLIEQNPQGDPLDPALRQPRQGELDLLYELTEAQTGRLMFGVGVNSSSGLVGSIVLSEQNFDLFRPPRSFQDILDGTAFRGGGQRFRLEAVPGTEVSRYLVSWTDPYIFDTNYSLTLSGFYYQRYFQDWSEQREGGRINVGYQFSPQWSASAAIRLENVELYDADLVLLPGNVIAPQLLADAVGDSFLSTGRVSVVHDTRDAAFLPGSGHRAELSYEQAFGDFDYPRIEGEARQYFTLRERPDGGGRHTLAVGGQVGWTGDDTPIFERFFAGGFQTFRGFDFRGVGPQEVGVRLGGTWMALGTVEYQFPLLANDMLQGVVFSDFGTVEDDVAFEDFRASVGAGLRVSVPALGPVPLAFDWAVPIVDQDTDDRQIFSFYIGVNR